MKQEQLTIERALQVIQQALDAVTTNGPERRLIDNAYLTIVNELHKQVRLEKTAS